MARSSAGGVVIRYVLPVSRMTSYFHIIGHMQGCRCNTGTASQPGGAAERLGRARAVAEALHLPFCYRLTEVFPEKRPLNGCTGSVLYIVLSLIVCTPCIRLTKVIQVTGFYRAMLCIRGTSHGPVSVCPSVTSRSSTKTAERIELVFGM